MVIIGILNWHITGDCPLRETERIVSCAYWFADSKTIDGESVVNVRCVRKEPETCGRKELSALGIKVGLKI